MPQRPFTDGKADRPSQIDNILETFGYQPPSEELFLSKEEHELIQKYRQHEEMQNAVKKLLGVGED